MKSRIFTQMLATFILFSPAPAFSQRDRPSNPHSDDDVLHEHTSDTKELKGDNQKRKRRSKLSIFKKAAKVLFYFGLIRATYALGKLGKYVYTQEKMRRLTVSQLLALGRKQSTFGQFWSYLGIDPKQSYFPIVFTSTSDSSFFVIYDENIRHSRLFIYTAQSPVFKVVSPSAIDENTGSLFFLSDLNLYKLSPMVISTELELTYAKNAKLDKKVSDLTWEEKLTFAEANINNIAPFWLYLLARYLAPNAPEGSSYTQKLKDTLGENLCGTTQDGSTKIEVKWMESNLSYPMLCFNTSPEQTSPISLFGDHIISCFIYKDNDRVELRFYFIRKEVKNNTYQLKRLKVSPDDSEVDPSKAKFVAELTQQSS